MQKSQKSSAAGRPAVSHSICHTPAAPPHPNFAIVGTKKNVCESLQLWTPIMRRYEAENIGLCNKAKRTTCQLMLVK